MHGVREEEAVGALLDFPHGDVTRVRLLLGRRVLWLRRHWEHNPLREYRGMVISDQQADALLAGQDRAAEQAFYHDDPEAVGLSQAIEEHAGRLAERDAGLLAAGAPTPMQRLAAVLGLSPFEQDVLLLALAAEVAPAIADLYGYVQDDATRRSPTLELALSLCATDEPDSLESRRRLVGQASLERFSLTVPEPAAGPAPTLRAGYRLDDRIRDYLLGVNRVDDRAGPWVREVPVEPLAEAAYPSELQRIEELVRAAVDRVPDWLPVINLVGPDMVDRPGLARAACDRLGVRLLQIDPASLPAAAGERTAALRLLEREALLIPAAFYLDLPRPAAGEPAADPAAVLDELGALVFAGSWRPLPPPAVRSGRSLIAVEVAPPGPVRRRELWGLVAGGGPASDDDWLDRLTEQFRVGPVEIRRAAEAAGRLADPPLSARDLWRACRVNAAGDLDDLALRLEPGATWDDLVLPAESSQALREIAAQVVNQTKVYERWGFGAKLRRGRGISVLFSGPSGTGKTMAAEVLASDLSLDLYRVDLSGVVSKYIGETEKNLRRVFDAAASGGAILFFDEADALFGKRSEVKDSHDRYANIEVNYLLQRMEDHQGLAVLATNMKSALDPAFLRRLRFLIEFPFPDAPLRERIWRGVLPARAEVAALDYQLLCSWEITGGNIRNIAVNAAFQAASEGVPIGMPQLLRAARREYAKIGKLARGAEFAAGAGKAGP
jgi:ATPase family associated with various cellular activities (AAA)